MAEWKYLPLRQSAFEDQTAAGNFNYREEILRALTKTTDKCCTGYTMRYFPTTTHILPERNKGQKLWLARGKDQAGNVYENA